MSEFSGDTASTFFRQTWETGVQFYGGAEEHSWPEETIDILITGLVNSTEPFAEAVRDALTRMTVEATA